MELYSNKPKVTCENTEVKATVVSAVTAYSK